MANGEGRGARGEGRTIALINVSIEKVLITKYEVPIGPCLSLGTSVRA